MDHLWSPWRYRYVSTAGPEDACIFCAKSAAGRDEDNRIVYRGERNFVILNLYPYTSGHLMVAPYEHVASIEETSEETAIEMMLLVRQAVRHLRAVYRPRGLNLGMNIGDCAGAGIAGHIHMHVVPRWTGDANFMSVVGETRVMPEDIPETYSKLKAAFAQAQK
ncbi:MAG: HIT domain-containing protein [Acidobacteriales bacterium]|nr:HIT domain-containing protein [Terriglobales bacterium]